MRHVQPIGPVNDSKLLWVSGLCALAMEFFVVTGFAWYNHWLSHPQKQGLDESQFIEAQVFQMPKEEDAHLHSERPVPVREAVLSKVADQGRKAKPNEKPLTEENQTKQGPSPAESTTPNHGPVAVFTPSPSIPSYLQSADLKVSVVIEFLVSSQGLVTPRLLASSGNEELDAIALKSAKQWQFRPAEQDHKPVDSKVRLRILFEVK